MKGYKPKVLEVGDRNEAPKILELGFIKLHLVCDYCEKGGEKCECKKE